MIEIVPNLHPITVHYPIALLSITTLLFLIAVVLRPSFSKELLITSKGIVKLTNDEYKKALILNFRQQEALERLHSKFP